ncbi:MAG: hypothetical protein NT004_01620 [Bacteroidetes bacterium]|nr:hypothetical protein [Bacteroidota bacterium]
MALKEMSIRQANEIVDIYSALLQNKSRTHKIMPYSALMGYDIFDVDNAIKIVMAEEYYRFQINDARLSELKNSSSGMIAGFSFTLIPDEFFYEIDRANLTDDEYLIAYSKYIGPPYHGMVKKFYEANKERGDSFIEYCVSLNNTDSNYWEMIYKRLDLVRSD